jgi:sodium/bile acid cotransporter 7
VRARPFLERLAGLRLGFRADPFLAGLVGAVTLAVFLPACGAAAPIANHSVFAAVALLFFLYGARLSPAAVVTGLSHWRLQGLVFTSTFILFPLIGLAVTTLTWPYLPPALNLGVFYLCLLPSTVQSSIAFTAIAGGNVPAALCSASVSNLLGIAVTPLLVTLFLQTHGSGFNGGGVLDIAVQLLLPFVAGQILRPAIGGWLLRHGAVTSYVDRGSILLIVYAAFSEGMVAGIWTQLTPGDFVLVMAADFVILMLILATTAFLSRRLGFSRQDEIAIVFCGSKKSMAAGIPMANILFPGQGTAVILLPVMLFHQIQLFVCAALARRYARAQDKPITQID